MNWLGEDNFQSTKMYAFPNTLRSFCHHISTTGTVIPSTLYTPVAILHKKVALVYGIGMHLLHVALRQACLRSTFAFCILSSPLCQMHSQDSESVGDDWATR